MIVSVKCYLDVPSAGLISGPSVCHSAQLTAPAPAPEVRLVSWCWSSGSGSGTPGCHSQSLCPLCLASLLSLTTPCLLSPLLQDGRPREPRPRCLPHLASARSGSGSGSGRRPPPTQAASGTQLTQGSWHLAICIFSGI